MHKANAKDDTLIKDDHRRAKLASRRPLNAIGPVLVVEDDGLIALDIAGALADAGATPVITCASIAQAMEHLGRTMPAVLVLDVHLADRNDGWALAELAIQLGEVRPLVVFTTGTPESIPPSAAMLGHVLGKPFRTEDLIALIHRHKSAGWFGRMRGALSNLN